MRTRQIAAARDCVGGVGMAPTRGCVGGDQCIHGRLLQARGIVWEVQMWWPRGVVWEAIIAHVADCCRHVKLCEGCKCGGHMGLYGRRSVWMQQIRAAARNCAGVVDVAATWACEGGVHVAAMWDRVGGKAHQAGKQARQCCSTVWHVLAASLAMHHQQHTCILVPCCMLMSC